MLESSPMSRRAPSSRRSAAPAALEPAEAELAPGEPEAAEAEMLDQADLGGLAGYAITRAQVQLKRNFQRSLGQPLGLKAVEFSVLVLVDGNPEVNQKQLGAALDVSPPNLAVILDRMAAQGWLRRERSERDRRAQQLVLTPAGRSLCQKARKIASTMEQEVLGVLSAAERALLIELLHRVANQRGR